jgi:hypothetical protein
MSVGHAKHGSGRDLSMGLPNENQMTYACF